MSGFPPLRWAVLVIDFDPVVGHEQGHERRALAVSYEPFHRAGLVTVCPITAAHGRGRYPNEVEIPIGEGGQTKPGVILCHQVRTVSVLRAGGMLQSGMRLHYVVDPTIRQHVRDALTRHFGLDIPPAVDVTGS